VTPPSTPTADTRYDVAFGDRLALFWGWRQLVLAFVRRELAIRYKEAYVGVAWAILQPLAYMAVFTLLFSHVAHVAGGGALSSLTALVAWGFFATSLTQGSQSVVNQLGVVSKIFFPRSALPLAAVIAAGFDAVIAFGLQLVLLASFGHGLSPALLLWPVLMLLLGSLCIGATLLLSPVFVRFRDLKYLLPVAVQLLLLASPVGYPLDAVPESLRAWYMVNPLAGLLESFRRIAIDGSLPPLNYLWPAAVWAVALLVLGGLHFRRAQATLADYV
jgi:lipopolysaccharide transport system permease protein